MVRYNQQIQARSGTVSSGGLGYSNQRRIGPVRPNYQRQAYNQLGFIQGGRFLRTQKAQNYMARSSPGRELKCVDANVDLAFGSVLNTTNTNAGIATVNLIVPGTGSWNRIGKKIRMASIRYRMTLTHDQTNSDTDLLNNVIRITLVFDKQPSAGAVPAFSDIFGSTSQLGTETVQSFLDGQRVDNTSRFSVLRDDVITSDMSTLVTTLGGSNNWKCELDRFVKLKGLETIFSGQSSPCTIADIANGALYLIFRAESNSGTRQWSVSSSTTRLRYYD